MQRIGLEKYSKGKLNPHKSLAKKFAKHKSITPHTIEYLEEGIYKTGKGPLIHQ